MVDDTIRRLQIVAEPGFGPYLAALVWQLAVSGLMFVRLAKLAGARVVAVGRRQTQLDRAERMGADGYAANPIDAVAI